MKATSRNWYMNELFGEKVLDKPATIVTAVIMVVGLVASFAGSQVGAENFVGTSLAMYMPLATMNEGLLQTLLGIVLFAIAGPVVGCLLAGLDRKDRPLACRVVLDLRCCSPTTMCVSSSRKTT